MAGISVTFRVKIDALERDQRRLVRTTQKIGSASREAQAKAATFGARAASALFGFGEQVTKAIRFADRAADALGG